MSTKKTEELLIKRFSRDLELLSDLDEEKIARLADDEYRDILHLSKKLREIDFSKGSKAREELKKKLMSILDQNKGQQSELSPEELDPEELDQVAGGLKKDEDYPLRDK